MTFYGLVAALAIGGGQACTDSPGADEDSGASGSGNGNGNDQSSDQSSDQSADLSFGGSGSGSDASANGGMGAEGSVCESTSSEARLSPVYLGFAFDVSGSMGLHQAPEWWYDPALKWTPVVEAIQAYFEDADSEGTSASLTFFPAAGNQNQKCSSETYEAPVTPMTTLPSTEFGAAFEGYETEVGSPLSGGDWRGGTPTQAAVEGVAAYLRTLVEEHPEDKFALVLVTDGLPMGCPDNSIDSVAASLAALADAGLPTYVIGIQNPVNPPAALPQGWTDWGECQEGPGGDTEPCESPNNLDELDALAVAGGTGAAILVDTNDPSATEEQLSAAIREIAAESASCEIPIPPNPTPGEVFDKDKVDVRITVDGETTRLDYDPACEIDGAWHYDDEDDPTSIELCPSTCDTVTADKNSRIEVDFLCEDRPPVIK